MVKPDDTCGIEGIAPTDRDTDRQGVRAWGAIGVGRAKMKIHITKWQIVTEP